MTQFIHFTSLAQNGNTVIQLMHAIRPDQRYNDHGTVIVFQFSENPSSQIECKVNCISR